jgi:hypothetical protein
VGAALLAAARRYSCSAELLTLAALLSVPTVWAHAGGESGGWAGRVSSGTTDGCGGAGADVQI